MCEIELVNYTKIIKGKCVLNNIDLKLQGGKIYKLQGHNGCGKTMLLRAISGLIYPTQGSAFINGEELAPKKKLPASLGVLIETPQFWKDYTGFEVLQYLADIKGEISKDDIKANMLRMGLEPDDKRTIRKYSLGMKQKLGIIQAIMEKPDILLLDEPVNALDREAIKMLKKVVAEEKERGALIVIAIHNSGEFDVDYDEVITMEEGKIIYEDI